MTPTDQARLDAICIDHKGCLPDDDECGDVVFLLSLLSQETKRADEAEARTWDEVALRADAAVKYPCTSRYDEGYQTASETMRNLAQTKAAAVRRGREGENHGR